MPNSPLVLLYDASGQPVSTTFAPMSGRPGQATYSPQGGLTVLGHDYGTSSTAGTAYAPKVDSKGNLYTASAQAATAGTAYASASAVVGSVVMGLNGLTPTPVQVDGNGNLLAATASLPTFSVYASGVATTSGKSLLALLNKSSATVLRLVAAFAQNTSTTTATLTAYYIYAEELRFFTGFSSGTTLTPLAFDQADTLASGITCATGATITGEVSPAIRRWVTSNYGLAPSSTSAEDTTADQQGRDAWVQRMDASAKPVTIRPGQGVHLKAVTTSTNGVQDLTFVFTAASS